MRNIRREPTVRSELPPSKKPKNSKNEGEPIPDEPAVSGTVDCGTTSTVGEPIPEEPIGNEMSHSLGSYAAIDHGYVTQLESRGCRPEIDTLAYLKSLAYSMVDNGLTNRFDNECLTVYFSRGQIIEKTCVIDRELKLEISVLGQPISDHSKIWQKYLKIWDMTSGFVAFLRDLSENWFVCKTSLDSNNVQKLRESSSKEDGYEFDSLTGTIRSKKCALLTTKETCMVCKNMIRNLRWRLRK